MIAYLAGTSVSLIETLLGLAMLALKLIAFVDALIRPSAAYQAAGKQTKGLWLVLTGLALGWQLLVPGSPIGLVNIIGIVAAIVYLVDVRPALREIGGGPRRRSGRSDW